MKPITERLAEKIKGWRECAARSDVTVAERNAITVICDDVDRILSTHPAKGGEGRDYVLVPREPTQAMRKAVANGDSVCLWSVVDIYRAMLAAAPPPQPVAPEEKAVLRAGTKLFCDEAEAYMSVVRDLFALRSDGPCLAERRPTQDTECLLAFQRLNDVGKRLSAMVAKLREIRDVAPERGEAKAVAWITDECIDALIALPQNKSSGCDVILPIRASRDRSTEYAHPIYTATPQPPPAPRFRDPTIEDAKHLLETYQAVDYKVDPDNSMLAALKHCGFALNAIGAKVEEKP